MRQAFERMFSATPLRLALGVVAILVLGLVGLAFYIGHEANRLMSERAFTLLQSELTALRRSRDAGGIERLGREIDARRTISGFLYRLARNDGHWLAGNLADSVAVPSGSGGTFDYIPLAQQSPPTRLAIGITVVADANHTLAVGIDIEDQRDLADKLRRATMIGIGGLTLLGLGFGWLVSRTLNQRLATINTTATAIMVGELSRRIDRDGSNDEIDTISANLNLMLNRIEELMGALREVSDNIAHDLKTPLTRLRNRAEAALRDPSGVSAFRDGLERTIEEADGLIQTFNALLLIARLEAGAVDDTKRDTDVTSLVNDVAELYQPVAEEAGLKLNCSPVRAIHASVNRQLIGQAVANLIDNAIKYSKIEGVSNSSSTIEVGVTTSPNGDPIIAIGDHGPGIPAKERARVLKRFVRLEQSRSAPGTGLGLSLVAAVARLHDGTIRLEDNAPGLRVELLLRGPRKNIAPNPS
ncbi:MAG: HAMP domain-containing protein [Hyphomicrobiaceae bacterium]|nr:HAMP domain-containing protein [Hyphomicrobiaceae bacterium]